MIKKEVGRYSFEVPGLSLAGIFYLKEQLICVTNFVLQKHLCYRKEVGILELSMERTVSNFHSVNSSTYVVHLGFIRRNGY